MADEAYAHRLKELDLKGHDADEYRSLKLAVAAQVSQLRTVLDAHEAREQERSWLKQQTQGELDEGRLVDGVAGASDIYRRRGVQADAGALFRPTIPKRIKFVVDISGSMYTFNRIDDRLRRLQEAVVFILEAFAGYDAKYDINVVGHSGTGPEAERFVDWGAPPTTDAERLEIARRMAAHAQFAHSGDTTLEATRIGIDDVAGKDADERFCFVVSDADLKRYGITPTNWNDILMAKHPHVQAYVILISSNEDEATSIVQGLAPGHAFICDQTDRLAVTFKQIFTATMLKNRA